ncbi:MAG: hypothetical protein ACREX8_02670 [Gammaproteobacteria bacterium]
MAAGYECAQRGADPSGASLVSINASPGADRGGILDPVVNNDFPRSRADELDAEAAYYAHRAMQEEQALGPGYYVDLLRGMAADRTAMAQRLRTGERNDVVRREAQDTTPLRHRLRHDRGR